MGIGCNCAAVSYFQVQVQGRRRVRTEYYLSYIKRKQSPKKYMAEPGLGAGLYSVGNLSTPILSRPILSLKESANRMSSSFTGISRLKHSMYLPTKDMLTKTSLASYSCGDMDAAASSYFSTNLFRTVRSSISCEGRLCSRILWPPHCFLCCGQSSVWHVRLQYTACKIREMLVYQGEIATPTTDQLALRAAP